MIGQLELKNRIISQIEDNTFPRFSILVGAVGAQMHSVKVPADGQLYGPGAGAVGAEISPPQLQLAPLPSHLGRVRVHCLTRQHRQCLLPPKAVPVRTDSTHSA